MCNKELDYIYKLVIVFFKFRMMIEILFLERISKLVYIYIYKKYFIDRSFEYKNIYHEICKVHYFFVFSCPYTFPFKIFLGGIS